MKNILVIDVGGTHVKILATGQREPRKFDSGPKLNAEAAWCAASRSLPRTGTMTSSRSAIRGSFCAADRSPNRVTWPTVGLRFDYEAALERPIRFINDAAMQALGSYQGGKMLFLGLGTGLGSTLIVDGIIEPMELGSFAVQERHLRGLRR